MASAGRTIMSLSVGILMATAASAQDGSSVSAGHIVPVPASPVAAPGAAAFPLQDVHLLDGRRVKKLDPCLRSHE